MRNIYFVLFVLFMMPISPSYAQEEKNCCCPCPCGPQEEERERREKERSAREEDGEVNESYYPTPENGSDEEEEEFTPAERESSEVISARTKFVFNPSEVVVLPVGDSFAVVFGGIIRMKYVAKNPEEGWAKNSWRTENVLKQIKDRREELFRLLTGPGADMVIYVNLGGNDITFDPRRRNQGETAAAYALRQVTEIRKIFNRIKEVVGYFAHPCEKLAPEGFHGTCRSRVRMIVVTTRAPYCKEYKKKWWIISRARKLRALMIREGIPGAVIVDGYADYLDPADGRILAQFSQQGKLHPNAAYFKDLADKIMARFKGN